MKKYKHLHINFNSCMVRLKDKEGDSDFGVLNKFQFLYGTIKGMW